MSRARSNFITNRNSLPQEIISITNNKKDDDNESSLGAKTTHKDKGPSNVLFYKKPKFIGNKKEFSSKKSEVKYKILY